MDSEKCCICGKQYPVEIDHTCNRDINKNTFPWKDTPPENDGEFFYSGKLPSGIDFVGIVHVVTDLRDCKKQRIACVFIPPFWRGDGSRELPTVEHGILIKWRGQWAGPDHGLSCVYY